MTKNSFNSKAYAKNTHKSVIMVHCGQVSKLKSTHSLSYPSHVVVASLAHQVAKDDQTDQIPQGVEVCFWNLVQGGTFAVCNALMVAMGVVILVSLFHPHEMVALPFYLWMGETEVYQVDHVPLTSQTHPSLLEEMVAIFLFHLLEEVTNDPYLLWVEMENLFHLLETVVDPNHL